MRYVTAGWVRVAELNSPDALPRSPRTGNRRLRRRDGHDAVRPRRLREPLLRRAEPLEPRPRAQVHDEYLEAGADVIETNTFGAHRFKLGPHGLEAQVRKINREGARIAREAAGEKGLVAGSMGPLGKPLEPIGSIRADEAQAAYREQAEGLLEGGVDVFVIETMPSLDQAKAALAAVRSLGSELPVGVSLTFNEEGNTLYGDTPEDVVRALEALGVPLVGANCSQGPQAMLETLAADGRGRALGEARRDAERRRARRTWTAATSTSARPSTWRPTRAASSRPARASSAAAAARRPRTSATWCARCGCSSRARAVEVKAVTPERRKEAPAPVPREEKTPARPRAAASKFVVSVELDPPRGADAGQIIERAQYCKENEVDAINVADGPRASARMSAQSLCVLLQEKVGIDTILHYTCRDRNLLGIQSDLLGAYALGLRNILAITGDPPKLGDYPDATAVYDVDSIGLIRIMDHLNHGADLAGNLIGPSLAIHVGCGADPSKPDMEKEVRRLEEKVKARRRVRHDPAGLRPANARALPLA